MRYILVLAILSISCGTEEPQEPEVSTKNTQVIQKEKEPVVTEEIEETEETEEVLIVSEEIESQAPKYLLEEEECQEEYINYKDIEGDYDEYSKHLDWVVEESEIQVMDSIYTPEGEFWYVGRALANEGYVISNDFQADDTNRQYNFCISI